MIAQSRRKKLWFGTLEHSQWLPTPNSGADVSASGWGDGGDLLNGGAYSFGSWGSHRTYQYEWPVSSSREAASIMTSYANGTYGRGLLYFQDPLTYDTNVLPANWADPSMTVGFEGSSPVYGVDAVSMPQSPGRWGLPVRTATWDLSDVTPGFRGEVDAVYVTIPEGYTLALGAFYSVTGSGGIYATPYSNGGLGTATRLTELSDSSPAVVFDSFSGVDGVWLWIGREDSTPSSVTAGGLIGRLISSDKMTPGTPEFIKATSTPWMAGDGHSGCRFSGKPTRIEMNGIGGGQVQYAATLVEVGSWANG